MGERKPVPPYEHNSHYPVGGHTDASVWSMNRQQAGFYRRWQNAWKRGETLDVEGHIDYVRRYISQKLWEIPRGTALPEIIRIHHHYGDGANDILTQEIANIYIFHGAYNSAINVLEAGNQDNYYISYRIADCQILLGDYGKAHGALDHLIQFGARQRSLIDSIWSLKLIAGESINGGEVLTLLGPQVTDFGKRNIDKICECLDELLATYETEKNVRLLELWAAKAHSYRRKIDTGVGPLALTVESGDDSKVASVIEYSFARSEPVIHFVKQITRLAENIARVEIGLPRVGEGWPSETQLYQEIKRALPECDVQQHYRPHWLDRQHLDIYVHELGIALEYQGLQHDEPIEYFGGHAAFELNRERDARKKRLCDRYGVHIIYVRPGYCITEVLHEIGELAAVEIELESAKQDVFSSASFSGQWNELLQIDAMREAEPDKSKYRVDPSILIEPIRFDLEYKVSMTKVKRYKELSNEIHAAYKPRLNPGGIDEVADLCLKQIPLAYNYAQYKYQDSVARSQRCIERAEACDNDPEWRQEALQAAERVMGYGYWQIGYQVLVKIYERRREYQAAFDYALRAKSECWYETPAWDKIIYRLSNRIDRREAKLDYTI